MRLLFALLLAAQTVAPAPRNRSYIWVDPITPPAFKAPAEPDIRFCVPAFHKSDMEIIPCPPVESAVCGGLTGALNPQDFQRCQKVTL